MAETEKNSYERLRHRIFEIIQIGNTSDGISRFFDVFIACVIILNIATLFLGTFDSMEPYACVLDVIEVVTMLVFIVARCSGSCAPLTGWSTF